MITKLEQETHEVIQYFLPQIAESLKNLVKEIQRENDLKEKELKCLTKK